MWSGSDPWQRGRMNLVINMRNIAVTNCGTWREVSKLSRAIYAPVERSNGRDPSRKKNAMGKTIRKPVLQRRHQEEGGGDILVSLSEGIPVEVTVK